MASEGLLGFIQGVTGTLGAEYDRMNEEKADIRKEGRAEEADRRAEIRREMAEKRIADYRKQIDFDWEAKAQDRERGLIESGQDIPLMRKAAEQEHEAKLYRSGSHPDTLREDASDLSKAARIRGGADSETAQYEADVERAPEKTKLEVDAETAKTEARLKAEEESDKRRRKEGNYKVGTQDKSDLSVSFTANEADELLRDNVSASLGASIADIQKRVKDGESVLAEVKTGKYTIPELIERDEGARDQIRQELAAQIYVQAKGEIMEAAKNKKVKSNSQIEELGQVVVDKADELIDTAIQNTANITSWRNQIAQGKKPKNSAEDILKGMESQLAEALGENEKRSAAFKQIWSTFKHTYERQLGIKVK